MGNRMSWSRTVFLSASAVAWFGGIQVKAASEAVIPVRSRAAALLTALFYHDAPAGLSHSESYRVEADKPVPAASAISSISPRQAMGVTERAKVVDFARSLVYEGGFFPKEIYQLLGYENSTTARIARLTRQLDHAGSSSPMPWEVAGRIGRSAMSGASDHWAMMPGEPGDAWISTPGTLAYLPTLAVVYAGYPADGREAAAQLATLKDDDMRAAPVARAALALLIRGMAADRHDKDEWLRAAAADSADSETEHDLRAVRVKEWRYLRGEECAMGRLERAVYIWYKSPGYDQAMAEGREQLRSRESLAYLAALSAATWGMESLPKRVIASGAADRQLLELINDLHDLAISEAVLRVEPESGW